MGSGGVVRVEVRKIHADGREEPGTASLDEVTRIVSDFCALDGTEWALEPGCSFSIPLHIWEPS